MDITANAAYLGLLYGNSIKGGVHASKSQRYICWAMGQMRYIVGDEVTSFVVGTGSSGYTHSRDRGASCPSPPAVCNAITGLYNPAVRALPTTSRVSQLSP